MKLSKAQIKELECLNYFTPSDLRSIPISEKDKEMYFEWSEQGKHKELVNPGGIAGIGHMTGLNVLFQAKRWRGIHIHELWEPGVLEASVPYSVLLGADGLMPRAVVDFMKREMFKGMDANMIEECYQMLSTGT